MFDAIERGWFADTPAPRDGGRGLEGVAEREPGYHNPFLELWEPQLAGGPWLRSFPTATPPATAWCSSASRCPCRPTPGAREVGLQFLRNNGFREPQIVHAAAADRDMTFYVAYAKAARGVDPGQVDGDRGRGAARSAIAEVNALIERELGRQGGRDRRGHRVRRPHGGDRRDHEHEGVRRRLRAGALSVDRRRQPGRPGAVRAAACGRRRSGSADAILVSQVVTQKQVHARQLTKLVDLLEAEGLRDRYLLICRRPAAVEHVRQGARVRRRLRARLDALAGRGLGREELIQRKGE